MSDEFFVEPHVCGRFHQAIELIGRRWSGAIIYALTQKPRRFSDFRDVIPELSDRLLTERLKELEEAGVVLREVGPGRPIQVIYRLTPKGLELQPVMDAIGTWAQRWEGREP
jgi:DNA-binding HxlR family transcriptional regulator